MTRCKIVSVQSSIMCRVVYLLTILASLSISSVSSINSRIVGGEEAAKNGYPYQALIRIHGKYKCSGSLIDNEWILTAAHCLADNPISNFIVVLGSNNLVYGGVAFRVAEIHLHSKYVRSEKHDDIGLIKLGTKVEYSSSIAPIRLPFEDFDDNNRSAVFTGWGRNQLEGSYSLTLKVIQLTTVKLDRCRKTFPSVTRSNICTDSGIGQGLCYGDAGGVLVVDGVQIGIGSWGSPCARGYPDVHTRVYSYVDWIHQIIAQGSDD